METNLQFFYNEEANVTIRTQQVNNEPWFVAKDVANALDITWSGHTLDSIPESWKGMVSFTTPSSGNRGGGTSNYRSSTNPLSTNWRSGATNRKRMPSLTGWQEKSSPPSVAPVNTGSRARWSAYRSNNNASACPSRNTVRSMPNGRNV